jgi:hypothetical protein
VGDLEEAAMIKTQIGKLAKTIEIIAHKPGWNVRTDGNG